ncbi:MAG: BlaI/MecI/CopY family transcriptional regulator [Clostridiales bacterium]|nr:BlaI/MecI/CopY family transcriptional regulator [Clostridiales bacterium]
MKKDINFFKLTNRELEVMRVFWNSDTPKTATDIESELIANGFTDKKNNIFTVQNMLKSLLNKGAIEVASYKRVQKTTAREYIAHISDEEYAIMYVNHHFPSKNKTLTSNIVASFLDYDENEEDTINALEKLLAERRAKL